MNKLRGKILLPIGVMVIESALLMPLFFVLWRIDKHVVLQFVLGIAGVAFFPFALGMLRLHYLQALGPCLLVLVVSAALSSDSGDLTWGQWMRIIMVTFGPAMATAYVVGHFVPDGAIDWLRRRRLRTAKGPPPSRLQ